MTDSRYPAEAGLAEVLQRHRGIPGAVGAHELDLCADALVHNVDVAFKVLQQDSTLTPQGSLGSTTEGRRGRGCKS